VRITQFHVALAMALALPSLLQAGFCSSDLGAELRHDFQLLAGYSPASIALIHVALDRRFVLAGRAGRFCLQLYLLGLAFDFIELDRDVVARRHRYSAH